MLRWKWCISASGIALAAVGLWWLRLPAHLTNGKPNTEAMVTTETDARTPAWLKNVAGACGIDFRHVSGRNDTLYMPEIMAGGVGLFDFDDDGYLDVYFVQGGRVVGAREGLPANKLYRNLGDGSFEDVSDDAGVADQGYGMGCACGDFDNDGRMDLYVTNVGANVLYRNNGDGTFTDVTARAGVGDPSFSASAAFFDYDRDGDLDLFVVNYIRWSPKLELVCRAPDGQLDYCKPISYSAPAPDTLYQNNGNGTFTDVSASTHISTMFGNGLGIVCGDFTGDGWLDVCVANDETANQLWINQRDGTFRDEALERGVAFSGDGYAEAGMGIDAQDIDDDHDLDLIMTHFAGETNTLYINESGFWEDRTNPFALAGSRPFTGFGVAFVDLNNDGLLDLYVANGRVVMGRKESGAIDPYAEPNLLFQGLKDQVFREVFPRGGTPQRLLNASRGAAFGDYDNDGGVDIFVVNRDGPAYILHNRAAVAGNWIVFDVRNVHGSPAIGAHLQIDVHGRRRTREVRTAYSYCASNDPRVHLGLGSALRADDVTVTWPDGAVQRFGSFAANRIVVLARLDESSGL